MRAAATDRHATAMALVKEREATGAAGRTATTMVWVKDKAAEVLSEASQRGRVMEVKRLLDCGVDVNSKDEAGAAALHWAVAYNQPDVVKLLLVVEVLFHDDSQVEYLFSCAAPWPEACLLFCYNFLCLWLQSVQNYFEHYFTRVANQADSTIILALLKIAFLGEGDNQGLSPPCWPFTCLPDLVTDYP